jgi:uncharacterized membrane protein YagU involved in acid resistance
MSPKRTFYPDYYVFSQNLGLSSLVLHQAFSIVFVILVVATTAEQSSAVDFEATILY